MPDYAALRDEASRTPGRPTTRSSSTWLVTAGQAAVAQFITIIGIPLGIANIKLVPISLFPLGHEIVDVD